VLNGSEAWRFRPESTSLERLDGETIVIDFDSGNFYSFRESAADVVWLVAQARPRAEWIVALAPHFSDFPSETEALAQIDEFVESLRSVGLVEECPPGTGEMSELPDDYPRDKWGVPVVNVNDSLSDLLAIDPIHDVSDQGWPEALND
jgi:hypothetical protein